MKLWRSSILSGLLLDLRHGRYLQPMPGRRKAVHLSGQPSCPHLSTTHTFPSPGLLQPWPSCSFSLPSGSTCSPLHFCLHATVIVHVLLARSLLFRAKEMLFFAKDLGSNDTGVSKMPAESAETHKSFRFNQYWSHAHWVPALCWRF